MSALDSSPRAASKLATSALRRCRRLDAADGRRSPGDFGPARSAPSIERAGGAELNYKRSTSGAQPEPLLMAEPETILGSHLLAIIFVKGGSARRSRRA